jgi:hypothetical protein
MKMIIGRTAKVKEKKKEVILHSKKIMNSEGSLTLVAKGHFPLHILNIPRRK